MDVASVYHAIDVFYAGGPHNAEAQKWLNDFQQSVSNSLDNAVSDACVAVV